MIGLVVRSNTLNEGMARETRYFCLFFFFLIKRFLRGSLWQVKFLPHISKETMGSGWGLFVGSNLGHLNSNLLV